MKNYYDDFVDLSMKLISADDLADKGKVRKNNRIVDKLHKLMDEVSKTNLDVSELVFELLHHEHEKVRIMAASWGAKLGVHIDVIKTTLEDLYVSSDDAVVRLDAIFIYEDLFGENLREKLRGKLS